MKPIDAYALITGLDEDIILDAIPPTWTAGAAPLGHYKESRLARFMSSGAIAAILSVIVSAGLLIGLVALGRQGMENPATTSTETNEETVAETDAFTGVAPGLLSTTPYKHPLNSPCRLTVSADGESTELNWGYIYRGDLYLKQPIGLGYVSDREDYIFEHPPIDAHYLWLLSADPILPTVYAPVDATLSYDIIRWSSFERASTSIHSIYDERFELLTTEDDDHFDEDKVFESLTQKEGIYYIVFEVETFGGTHKIGDQSYGANRYANYQIPCRVVVGDVPFTPPESAPEPPAPSEPGVQSIFSEKCFESNGDGTCIFRLKDPQIEPTIQIPTVSPAGDIVTEVRYMELSIPGTTLIIPDNVTTLFERIFEGDDELQTVIIGTGVREIPPFSFMDCENLTEVILTEGQTVIGQGAFHGCWNLTKVVLPDSLQSIGVGAFSECRKLEEITFPANLKSIDERAFASCERLRSAHLPEGLTTLNARAFDHCTSLTSVSLPGSLESIGDEAFSFCDALTEVTISSGVRKIGHDAFAQCTSLERLALPDTLTSISFRAFSGCSRLANVVLPDSIREIGVEAFAYTAISGINLPTSMTALPDGLFYHCKNVTEYTIPDHITSIGSGAFGGTSIESMVIPAHVTSVGNGVFTECAKLTSVHILGPVSTLGNYFFDRCTLLSDLVLPDTVKRLEIQAFAYCTSLKELRLPGSLCYLGNSVFTNSGFKDIYFDGTMEEWRAIERQIGWQNGMGVKTIHCTDGDLKEMQSY